MTATIGPKISSVITLLVGSPPSTTVGANQKPGPLGQALAWSTVVSASRNELTLSWWAREISGPMSTSSVGRPVRNAATASINRSTKWSYARSSTRMRLRAQQSWPALSNTAPGAAAAAASTSASANTTVADLPPSSSETRFTVSARTGEDRPADPRRAGEAHLADEWMGGERGAGRRAPPGHHLQHAVAQADRVGEAGELEAGEWRQLRRLEHDGVAGCQRRCHLPRGDEQREVPRRDRATTPIGSFTVNASPPATLSVRPPTLSMAPA